jgi:hypothetical protein
MPRAYRLFVYVAARKVSQRLRSVATPPERFISMLGAQWPVSIVWVILSLCFVLPGLASRQTSEALLGYARGGDAPGVVWLTFLLTSLIATALGAVLAHWSGELLKSRGMVSAFSGWFPIVAVALAFWGLPQEETEFFYPYRLMAVGVLVAPLIYLRLWRKLIALVPQRWSRPPQILTSRGGGPAYVATALVLVMLFGSSDKDRSIGLPLSPIALAQTIGPVNILLLFLATFTSMASMLVMAGRFLRLPLAAFLFLLVVGFSWYDLNDNHRIRRSQDQADEHPDDVQKAFARWIAERPDKDRFDDYPVVVVSAEGGGIRAAFFTAITLARLVDRCPAIADHIFAISGVSGGAVGAALFAAAMKARPPDTAIRRCNLSEPAPPYYENALADILGDDHLSPVLARALFPDAFQRILPFPVFAFDRQLGLELSLERSFRRVFGEDVMAHSIYNIQADVTATSVPFLLLNTTEVDGGRRFVMTPLYLRTEEFNGVQDWHWLDWQRGPPLSTAAGTSARFPVVSPAGYALNNGRKTRYVDGGYADNSGTVTLMELYSALYLLREQKYLDKNEKGKTSQKFSVVALHIGNAPACNVVDPTQDCQDIDALPPVAGGLGELFSPINTVINVRSAQVEYNLRRFQTELDRGTDFDRFDFHNRVQMYDRGVPVPLGWLLSKRVRSELRAQLDRSDKQGDCRANDPLSKSNFCELSGVAAAMTWAND